MTNQDHTKTQERLESDLRVENVVLCAVNDGPTYRANKKMREAFSILLLDHLHKGIKDSGKKLSKDETKQALIDILDHYSEEVIDTALFIEFGKE